MEPLWSILIIIVAAAACFWVINHINWSPDFAIVAWVLRLIVGVLALIKLIGYLR